MVKGVIGIQSLDISQVGDTLKYDAVILNGEGALLANYKYIASNALLFLILAKPWSK